MNDRTNTRSLWRAICAGALLTVAAFALAACGGSDGGSGGQGGRQQEEQVGGTTGGDMESVLGRASSFPEAARTAEGSNDRFRGSQDVPPEDFVAYVIADSDAKWQSALAEAGIAYEPVGAVIFEEPTNVPEGCGDDETLTVADPTGGPFYCPPDQTIYWPIDGMLRDVPIQDYGDFAVAAGAAHEVGHHVQQQLGIFDAEEVLDIQTELQADCFAGMWGFSTYYEGFVEPGDVDEAITLLGDIGDSPESPRGGPGAHGSPEERVEAFTLGYDSGDPAECLAYTPAPSGSAETTS